MNPYLVAAALVTFVVGAAHSALGEVMIFRRLRRGGFVPTEGGPQLRERHVRILWASWHVLTVLGWTLAALLVRWPDHVVPWSAGAARIVAAGMAISGTLVGVAARGRHPGWVGLWVVAVLVLLGLR